MRATSVCVRATAGVDWLLVSIVVLPINQRSTRSVTPIMTGSRVTTISVESFSQAARDDALESHDVAQAGCEQLAEEDPRWLHSARFTMFSTIRQAVPRKPQVESAWRRHAADSERDKPSDSQGSRAASRRG